MDEIPSHEGIERAVVDSTNEVIRQFRARPYAFLYEADLQALLLCQIRSRLPEHLDVGSGAAPGERFLLSFAYAEYSNRLDVACIDPAAVSDLARSVKPHFGLALYGMPLHVGIELKYWKDRDRLEFVGCLRDLAKFERRNPPLKHALLLAFLQKAAFERDFFRSAPQGWEHVPIENIPTPSGLYVISPRGTFACTKRHATDEAAPGDGVTRCRIV